MIPRDRAEIVSKRRPAREAFGRQPSPTPSPWPARSPKITARRGDPARSRRVVRMDKGVLITETHTAGSARMPASISPPSRPTRDAPARRSGPLGPAVRDRVRALTGRRFVIISDTFGRPCARAHEHRDRSRRIRAVLSYLGERDPRPSAAGDDGAGDELAGAAEPVMGQARPHPRGDRARAHAKPSEEGSKPLLREPARDLFR